MEISDKDLNQDDSVNLKGPPEKPQVVVDLSEPDDDEPEGPAAAPVDRKTRREQARDFRRQREEFQTKLGDYERQLSELKALVAARPQQAAPTPAQPPVNEYDSKIASLSSQYDALVLAIQAPGQSQEQVMKLVEQARKLDDQRAELRAEKILEARLAARGEGGGQSDSFIRQAMDAEFPQIMRNEALRTRALAEAADLVHNKGKPWGLETARESARRALAAFGMGGKPPAPSDADRARFSNVPSRAGAQGGGTGNTYAPPPFELKMARAWVKGRPGAESLTDEEAWRTWSRETGNRRQAG